ncbi:AcrR family transcriptional regulator [Actinoplanes tereljensis]|uniref:TetR family transcriptional regulator n=1 Tax=Paractinoplanes tereljensis TaxID=571912 RepID=A0A919TTD7_9ACTN|nr:TetR/AcrR family transcriptional regulator C-terminal domain-containing protein [Actinoplanes tereljensis]GIF21576.1 TetR family transcriptional regulator [Actinoplanes tereljensis]
MSREPLSRERALAAAVAIADVEGLKALTMRRLAAAVEVEAMSLYYHLPGKEGLLDGLASSVVAEILAAPRSPGGDWRSQLRERFLAAREVMLLHPWAPAVLGSRPAIPPALFGYYDEIVGTLTAAGFTPHLAHRALHAFGTMALGFVQELFTPGTTDTGAAEAEMAEMAAAVPHLTAMMDAEVHAADADSLGWCDTRAEFEFTLDLLLDGLERHRAGI